MLSCALSHSSQDPKILERRYDKSGAYKEPENHHLRLTRQEKYHIDSARQHSKDRG
jgi:hypothetical protein